MKRTPGTTAASMTGRSVKRGRGRPKKGTTSTPAPTGSEKWKPGRPRKFISTPQTPASTIAEEFRTKSISKRLKRPEPHDGDKRFSILGQFQRSPWKK
jgi:hypothetical protein